jgi:hypothetical protein
MVRSAGVIASHPIRLTVNRRIGAASMPGKIGGLVSMRSPFAWSLAWAALPSASITPFSSAI